MNRDPIEELLGCALHVFALNNPLLYVDLYGLTDYPIDFIGPVLPGDQFVLPPSNWPTPPDTIPGAPWRFSPDPGNRRGGTLRPVDPPSAGGSRPTLTWSPPTKDTREGNPDGYWKLNDGKGNTQRYDCNGNEITPGQAHPGRPDNANDDSGGGWEKFFYFLRRFPLILIPNEELLFGPGGVGGERHGPAISSNEN